jgi:hypothetical protein
MYCMLPAGSETNRIKDSRSCRAKAFPIYPGLQFTQDAYINASLRSVVIWLLAGIRQYRSTRKLDRFGRILHPCWISVIGELHYPRLVNSNSDNPVLWNME